MAPADRTDDDRRLEQAKLDAMKELAYGASHEINNPLANISARAQTLLRDEGDPERRRALEAIHQQALRAHEMIADLMLFARPPKLLRQRADVLALCRDVLAELTPEAQSRDIALELAAADDVPTAMCDAVQIAVALRSLLANALEAIGREGRVEVRVGAAASGDRPALRIEVRDNGPGIPPEARTHLFDPFYSGREAGRGLGFGLSKCWRIVTDHGGDVRVESDHEGESNSGARFVIELPVEAPSPDAP